MDNGRRAWDASLTEAHALAAKAIAKERQGDLGAAYSLCIKTAQTYLALLRTAPSEYDKQIVKTASNRVVARAEKIKAVKRDARPAPVNRLDELEQDAVLHASSWIASHRYPPWSDRALERLAETTIYDDPSGPVILAEDQKKRFASYRRLAEIASQPCILAKDAKVQEISQNCVTDCSVISALIACLHHHNRFGSKLGISTLHPQNDQGWPAHNPAGKYLARLHCNGIDRQVGMKQRPRLRAEQLTLLTVFDDKLPVDERNDLLCATMQPSGSFWAALLEKAYVKLLGGYTILGSIPSLDIQAFTGWIPETISLRDPDFRSERTWHWLQQHFNSGACVVTLGTGQLDVQLEGGHTLPSKHAYAVLEVVNTSDDRRLLRFVDPWNRAVSQASAADHGERSALELPWEQACAKFDTIFLNWDPAAFSEHATAHLQVDADEAVLLAVEMGISAALQPDPVWVQLSRHLSAGQHIAHYAATLQEQAVANSVAPQTGPAIRFTDSPQLLLKFEPRNAQARLALTLTCRGGLGENRFTVTCLSNCSMRLRDASSDMPYSHTAQGRWAGKSAGGNPSAPSFVFNPHHCFEVIFSSQPMALQAILTNPEGLPVSLKLFKLPNASQQRIYQYETAVLKADSSNGAYTHSMATLSVTDLQAGHYALIPSCYDAGTSAAYTLKLRSSHLIEPIIAQQEDAGRFVKVLRGEWGGSISSAKPGFRIVSSTACEARVRLVAEPSSLPVKVGIWIDADEVASSGPYAAYVSGVTVPPFRIQPSKEGCLVLPTVYTPGAVGQFSMTLLTDRQVRIEAM